MSTVAPTEPAASHPGTAPANAKVRVPPGAFQITRAQGQILNATPDNKFLTNVAHNIFLPMRKSHIARTPTETEVVLILRQVENDEVENPRGYTFRGPTVAVGEFVRQQKAAARFKPLNKVASSVAGYEASLISNPKASWIVFEFTLGTRSPVQFKIPVYPDS